MLEASNKYASETVTPGGRTVNLSECLAKDNYMMYQAGSLDGKKEVGTILCLKNTMS
jgi:hypothetical protein